MNQMKGLLSTDIKIVIVVVWLLSPSITTQDTCDSYDLQELDSVYLRARDYLTSTTFIDDNNVDGYYNISNLRMPTSPPAISACGTYNPIWMKGEFPSVGEGLVERTACQVGFFENCSKEYTIGVHNCNSYAVYRLEATIGTSAYCFDTYGEGVTLPSPEYLPPSATVLVILDWQMQEVGNYRVHTPHLVFVCSFSPSEDTSHEEYHYSVAWYVDGHFLVESKASKTSLDNTNLYDDLLTNEGYGLGISLECRVRVSAGENGYPNTGITSDRFFAGVEISNTNVQMYRGEYQTITLRPTVPVACRGATGNDLGSECKIDMVIKYAVDFQNNCVGSTSTVSVANSLQCGIEMTGLIHSDDVDNPKWNKEYEFKITSQDDADYSMDKNTFILTFQTDELAQNFQIWQNYLPGYVTVQIQDFDTWKRQTCHATIDPHMMTATGRPYECQYPGEYIMYKHMDLKQEVQIRTASCNSWAFCVCSVSIRAGGDVFHLNLCGSAKLEIFEPCQEREHILEVTRKSNTYYEIKLPTGTIVTLRVYGSWMNVAISLSVKDFEKSEGLCGYLSDTTTNDLRKRDGTTLYVQNLEPNDYSEATKQLLKPFIQSWQIDESESFLGDRAYPELWDEQQRLCVCPYATDGTSTGEEGSPQPEFFCSFKHHVLCNYEQTQDDSEGKVSCSIKRDTHGIGSRVREVKRLFAKARASFVEDTALSTSKIVKRSGFTTHAIEKRQVTSGDNSSLEDAKAYCIGVFNKTDIYSIKDDLPTNAVNVSIEECALDVGLSNDTSWALSHLTFALDSTDLQLNRDSNFTESNPEVTQTVKENHCPNLCNEQGTCNNGTCNCDSSYLGDDCSIDIRNGCTLTGMYNDGRCDLGTDDCPACPAVYGEDFVSQYPSAKIIQKQHLLSGEIIVKDPQYCVTERQNPYQAELCIQTCVSSISPNGTLFASSYVISMSFDGVHYGNAEPLAVFDSTCQEVHNNDGNVSFSLKDGFCFIENTCYTEGITRETIDDCWKCMSSSNKYAWTKEECPSNSQDEDAGSTDYTIVIAVVASIGSTVAIGLGAIIIYYFKCKRANELVRPSLQNLQSIRSPSSMSGDTTAYKDQNIGFNPMKTGSQAQGSFFREDTASLFSVHSTDQQDAKVAHAQNFAFKEV